MKISFLSPAPAFRKDLLDIANIFLGAPRCVASEDADVRIEIREHKADSLRVCNASISGRLTGSSSNMEPIRTAALHEKRLQKRQQKIALYQAFVEATGYHPPWGSLTGVRPTRLVLEEMGQGREIREAVKLVQQRFDIKNEKANLLLATLRVQASIPQAKEKEISCYVGVPFCVSRCRYCSFISREIGDGHLLPPYTRALVKEIAATITLIQEQGLRVRSLYVGGGTPTALPEEQLQQVMDSLQPLIQQADEITVEAGRPDTITAAKLNILRKAGTQRISINPQTMHDETLRLIGRRHTRAQTEQAFYLARDVGFRHINMDLIAGLAGEDEEMADQTLNWVLSLAPEAITIHTLSLKRSSDMYRYQDGITKDAGVDRMVSGARERLMSSGYEPYYLYRQKHMVDNLENVGYAKPGHTCLYNIDMMEDQTTVLAMGAGAISKRVWPGRTRIQRAPNVKDPEHYIARIEEMIERKTALFQDRAEDSIM